MACRDRQKNRTGPERLVMTLTDNVLRGAISLRDRPNSENHVGRNRYGGPIDDGEPPILRPVKARK